MGEGGSRKYLSRGPGCCLTQEQPGEGTEDSMATAGKVGLVGGGLEGPQDRGHGYLLKTGSVAPRCPHPLAG